jgi:hypothetical protein
MGGASSSLEVDVALPAGPAFAAVARLVVAGMAARLALAVDRVEDLQLAVDTIMRRSGSVGGPEVSFRMRPGADGLTVRVGPLCAADAELAQLEHVLSSLVDEVTTHDGGGGTWMDLEVAHRSLVPASR